MQASPGNPSTPETAASERPEAGGTTLSAFLDEAWQRLSRGVADRRAGARHPVLATAGAQGPEARMVVLRGADRAAARLTIHTDAASGKVAELRADPRATLLVWEPRAQLQIRMRATALLRPGSADEWARVPEGARRVYGGTPAPGTPIPAPDAHAPAAEPTRFLVVDCTLTEIDLLHLGRSRHRRARFTRADAWAGHWVAP